MSESFLEGFSHLRLAAYFGPEEVDGTLVFSFSAGFLLIPVAVGVFLLAFALIAKFKYKKGGRWVVGPFIGFAVSVGIFLPNMLRDRVTVTPTHIEQTTGFWFYATRFELRYDDVKWIRRKVKKTSRGYPNEKWTIKYKDGLEEVHDPGDLWQRNSDVIVPKLKSHGVDIR